MAFVARLIRRSLSFRPYFASVSKHMNKHRTSQVPVTSGQLTNLPRQHCVDNSLIIALTRNKMHSYWSKSPFELHVPCRFMTSPSSSGGCKPPWNDDKAAKEEKSKSEGTSQEPAKSQSKSATYEQGKENKPLPEPVRGMKHGSSDGKYHTGDGDLVTSDRNVVQNFHKECIKIINTQINHELKAAYIYIEMASFCGQDNVALFGFAKFFKHSYKEEIEHAEMLIDYLNKRGGELQLTPIPAEVKGKWKTVEELVSNALALEKDINQELLNLHACASQHGDPHLTNFLEEHYLTEQVDAIKTLADLLTRVRMVKNCCIHHVDRDLLKGVIQSHGDKK